MIRQLALTVTLQKSFRVPFSGVQPKAGQIHVGRPSSAIQNGENIFDLSQMVGGIPLAVPFSNSCLKPLCLKLWITRPI